MVKLPLSMTDVTVLKFDLANSSFLGAGFFISVLFDGQTLMVRFVLGSSLLVAVVLMVGCGEKTYVPKAEDIPDIPPSTRSSPGGGGGPATPKKGGNAVAPPK